MRLLTMCFPTYGSRNELHLNSRGDRVVLAPDEFHLCLLNRGWHVDIVSLAAPTNLRLFRSDLPLLSPSDVNPNDYDVIWHMFRDPTQPEVFALLAEHGWQSTGKVVLNSAFGLSGHEKHTYLPVLERHGLGPRLPADGELERVTWIPSDDRFAGARISSDRRWIETFAFNNNRGDYPSRKTERIVTEFVDNACEDVRSLARFGCVLGSVVDGFEYVAPAELLAFKTAAAGKAIQPYSVPDAVRPALSAALAEMHCDVCHVEAIPLGKSLKVIDVNPYPTASGKTLSEISNAIAAGLNDRLAARARP